jgi:predicted CXXCH cytochrome family protein
MLPLLLIAALAFQTGAPPNPAAKVAADAAGAPRPSSCVVCHGAEGRELALGGHARAAIGCVECHGGVEGPLEVEAAHAGRIDKLADKRAAIAACARCHSDVERMRSYGLRTDQASLYAVSQHGKRLAEDPAAEVATCVTCHGAHRVLSVSDSRSPVNKLRQVETCGRCHADAEFTKRHQLKPGSVAAYRDSVHGRALLDEGRVSSPACTDCHGSHGASPPRSNEVGHVCGQCHTVVQKYFEQSKHHQAALRGEIAECISCHGNHGVAEPTAEMLRIKDGSKCAGCHGSPDDPARRTATKIYDDLGQLDASIGATERLLGDAAKDGLFIDEESGFLEDARSLRIRARAVTHTLSSAALDDLLNRGQAMVETTRDRLAVKARSLRDRRIFTAIFFGLALLFAGVLQIYRQQISGAWSRGAQARGRP